MISVPLKVCKLYLLLMILKCNEKMTMYIIFLDSHGIPKWVLFYVCLNAWIFVDFGYDWNFMFSLLYKDSFPPSHSIQFFVIHELPWCVTCVPMYAVPPSHSILRHSHSLMRLVPFLILWMTIIPLQCYKKYITLPFTWLHVYFLTCLCIVY